SPTWASAARPTAAPPVVRRERAASSAGPTTSAWIRTSPVDSDGNRRHFWNMRFLVGVILLTGCFFHEEDDIFIPEPNPDLSVALPDLSSGDGATTAPTTL